MYILNLSLNDCFSECCGLFEIIRISDVLIKFDIGSYDFCYNHNKVIKS